MNRQFLRLAPLLTLFCTGCLCVPAPQCFRHPSWHPGPHRGTGPAAPLYPGDVSSGMIGCGSLSCGEPSCTAYAAPSVAFPATTAEIGCHQPFPAGCHQPISAGCHQPFAAGCHEPLPAGCHQPAGCHVPLASGCAHPAAVGCAEPVLMPGDHGTGFPPQPVPSGSEPPYASPRNTVDPQVREYPSAPAPVPPESDDADAAETQTSLQIPEDDGLPWLPAGATVAVPAPQG